MRVVISESCLQKIFDLPKEAQKSTMEFKRKFEQNSKSSGINLESIVTFKDKNLRTARINQKYRAIIRVPETGDIYYLLWVDNHDEAMDWAKNKVFEWNEKLQAGQIFVVPDNIESLVQPIMPAVESIPNLYDAYTDEQLLSIGVPELLLPLVRQIHDLTCLDKLEDQLPSEVYENLFYLSDGVSIHTILAEIEEGKKADDGVSSTNNRRHFIEVDDEMLERYLNGELEKWQLFLHPSQRSLVERNYKGAMKVTGGAGTGKTVVALHRLHHLSLDKALYGERPILFSTYTKALRDNLEQLIKKMGTESSRYELQNVDVLVFSLAKKYDLIVNHVKVLDWGGVKKSIELWEEIISEELTALDSKFLNDEYQQVILNANCKTDKEYYGVSRIGRGVAISRKQKMEVWALVQKYQLRKAEMNYIDRFELFNRVTDYLNEQEDRPYSHVIIDEVQDFSNVELRFVRALTEKRENDLFMVGDPYQNIYARKPSFAKAGINIQGMRSRRLRINYRTTEEIKRIAVGCVKDISYDDFEGNPETLDGYLSLYHGAQPQYLCFPTENAQQEKLVEILKDFQREGINPCDILISTRTNNILKEVKSYLYKQQISTYDLSVRSGDTNGIRLSTFHGMKGLEYKYVILYGVNDNTAPLKLAEEISWDENQKARYLQSEKSLMYVAMTRAVKQLIIMGAGKKSSLVGI